MTGMQLLRLRNWTTTHRQAGRKAGRLRSADLYRRYLWISQIAHHISSERMRHMPCSASVVFSISPHRVFTMKYTYASALSTGLTLFFVAFGNAQVVLAQQPTIVGVTGSMTQGSVVTINGSNLQAETMQGWDGFFANHPTAWSFEGPSPQSDGFSLIGPAGTTYDTSVRLLGNQSAKYHVQGSTPTCPAQVLSDYDAFSLAQPSNDIWIRAYVRWRANTSAWPNGHIKMLALHGYYVQPSGGTSLPSSFFGQYDGLSVYGNIPSGQLQNNRWYLVEAHIKNSAPTNYTVWIDGTQAWSRTDPQTGSQSQHYPVRNDQRVHDHLYRCGPLVRWARRRPFQNLRFGGCRSG